MEPFYPLHAFVCGNCFLVQLEDLIDPSSIYTDYAYYSAYSQSWLQHAKRYTEQMLAKYAINSSKLVVELGSNDGYLLQYFAERNIPVLGVEPALNVAECAINLRGIRTENAFFGLNNVQQLIAKYGKADLLIGNNILAHVPSINDFVSGMKHFLQADGVITMEFTHLLRLVERNQFDMISHEHCSYLSFTVVEKIFQYHGLQIFDVEELSTHGGSIRIYATHIQNATREVSSKVAELLKRENHAGMSSLNFYAQVEKRARETKHKILNFLITAKEQGKKIAGYGAPGKGNTLLNYCGIRADFIDYTVDRNPHKQGNFLPGTLIPIYDCNKIRETKPDYVFILPWNIKEEIMESMSFIQEWGGKFIIPIPELKVYDPLWLIQRYRKAS
jgi:hypothetical protein